MLIDLLRTRRSIRRYLDRPIEQEKIDILVEAMLRSPSSRSLNPWEFIVVSNPGIIDALSRAKSHGASFIKHAPLVIVVCADPAKCDVWIEDASIATLLIHLAAADLGLGSCWIQIRLRENASGQSAESHVSQLLDLRAGLRVEAMVAVGYPEEEKAGHDRATLLDERVQFKP